MHKILYSIKKLIKSHINVLKTIYINIKILGFKKGIRFPILVFGRIDLGEGIEGSINFDSVSFGVLRIGGGGGFYGRVPYNTTIFSNHGKIIVHGRCNILNGAIISVSKNGCLEIGKRVSIGANARIKCTTKIMIEDSVMISWDCQIFDTDFHYIVSGNEILRNNKSIYIGKYSWVGSRVTILKGTFLPENTVVATCSLVNKPFNYSNTSIVIGGIPAKIIGYDKKRFMLKGDDMQSLIEGDSLLNEEFNNKNIEKICLKNS